MKFLVISQRAHSTPDYRLNDLTGHGRIDILFRCILSAIRPLLDDDGRTTYTFMKNGPGYIESTSLKADHDEISLAAFIKDNWSLLYHESTIKSLINEINPQSIVLLSEHGKNIKELQDLEFLKRSLIILGAQRDIVEEDLREINSFVCEVHLISLGEISMLASQAITFIRQYYIVTEKRHSQI